MTQRSRTKPNKPMVPTVPTSLNRHALPSLRRHIGQPLGFGATDGRMPACRMGPSGAMRLTLRSVGFACSAA